MLMCDFHVMDGGNKALRVEGVGSPFLSIQNVQGCFHNFALSQSIEASIFRTQ